MILAEFHFDFLTPTGISEIRELCQHAYAAGWMQRGPVNTEAQINAWRRATIGSKYFGTKRDSGIPSPLPLGGEGQGEGASRINTTTP